MQALNRTERNDVYAKALKKWGVEMQATVAIEEMSEVIKEITKAMRGELNREHLAEEIADATIMLEQISQIYNINASVSSWVDYKIASLKRRVENK